MMAKLEPGFLATAIGSMPYTSPEPACQAVLKFLPHLPAWPQLPKRSYYEGMYVQFGEGLPGVVEEGERIYIDTDRDVDQPLRQLQEDYEAMAVDSYAISRERAAGFHAFLASRLGTPRAVKGHLTGPISCGLSITDQERKPIIYHDIFSDALAKHLRLKAAWQEKKLASLGYPTIIFVDEPYMSVFGSAHFALSREQTTSLLETVLGGIRGVKGVHCCGNTDWSVLLSTSTQIISFDAYNYAHTLPLYPDEVKAFLGRGGAIAWGIVPNDEESLAGETLSSLRDRLEEAMGPFTRKGIPLRQLLSQGLVTPSCGLAPLSPEASLKALELLSQLSEEMRKKL
ncbi:MAG TPA: methionine synthase [Dehalococcoidia bacterium]|nr:methionine synthase [Dehalococcoidia bacterium]